MNEIKLSTSRMQPGEVIDYATQRIAMAAPAPPKPPPIPNMATPVADLTTKLTEAKGANDLYEQTKLSLPGLMNARDEKAQALKDELVLFASAAKKESKGDKTQLQAVGFEVLSTVHSPAPALGQPQALALTEAAGPGSVRADCNPEPNASTYEWQTTTADPVNGPYVTFRLTTAAHVTITGLTSGSRVWVRVRVIGTKGESPWSDPATRIVL